MATIKIDDIEYDLDKLTANARAHLESIQAVDRKLADLQAEVAILQTARTAYSSALRGELEMVNET
jgi:hypothetical protein